MAIAIGTSTTAIDIAIAIAIAITAIATIAAIVEEFSCSNKYRECVK